MPRYTFELSFDCEENQLQEYYRLIVERIKPKVLEELTYMRKTVCTVKRIDN